MKTSALKRTAVCLLALLCLAVCFALPTAATEGKRVYDPVGMLTEADATALAAHMDELSSQYGVEMYLATYLADNRFDDLYGDEYCANVRNLYKENAVLLVVTYEEWNDMYYYDMYTYGSAKSAIKQNEVNRILDTYDVYTNLKLGHVYDGATAFFDLSALAYEGRTGVSWGAIIAVSAVIAVIGALVVRASIVAAYKKKRATVDYPLDRYAKLDLTREEDHYVTEHTTRVYSPRSSSSGGGSRHGGGGGHRGGR